MKKYLIIIEKGSRSYGAYVPDLPGCVAVGRTAAQAKKLIQEAVELHLEDMRRTGQTIPRAVSKPDFVEAHAA